MWYKRGTTYPLVITIPSINLLDAEWLIVSIKPHLRKPIEYTREKMKLTEVDGDTLISLQLTQEESLYLSRGPAMIDVNWMLEGVRGGTFIGELEVTETILNREVM